MVPWRRRWETFLFVLIAGGGLLVPAAGAETETAPPATPAVTEEVCRQPETGAERHLVDIEQLPVVPLAPPAVSDFPVPDLPAPWLAEVILGLLLGCAALGATIWVFRRAGGIHFDPIDRATAAVLLLALFGVGALTAAGDDLRQGLRFGEHLESATTSWRQGEHGDAEAQLLAARHLQSRPLIGWLPFYRPALERLDVSRLRTINGVAAVHQAVDRRDPDLAARAVEYLDAETAGAFEASGAAWSHRGAWLLADGETALAVDAARRADRLPDAGERTRSNLCVARYHHLVALVQAGDPETAHRQLELLDAPECDLGPPHATAVRGLAARGLAQGTWSAGAEANTAGAMEVAAEAYRYGRQRDQHLPFLACDFAAALDAHAIASLAGDRPQAAVDALDESETVIPDRPFVRTTLPTALYALGSQHLAAGEFEPAITAMDRGHRLTGGKQPMLVDGLSRAYLTRGATQVEAGETDRAIESFEQAFEVDDSNQITGRALADSLLVRGDGRLKAADLSAARPDFERAAEVSRRHRPTARMRLALMKQTPRRLEKLNGKPSWLGVPELRAEVPKDADIDGKPERVLYYGADPARPVAVGELSSGHLEPERLLLLDRDSAVAVMLRDLDGNGGLDERTTYTGGMVQGLIADVDRDGSQDVRVSYREGVEVAREHLSGRIRMVMREGVIGDEWMDFWSKADAYVKLFHNRKLVFVSDTVKDSNFPIWNQGVVIDYRYRDRVHVEVWDEDWFTGNDLIDTYTSTTYPESGVYAFKRRKAAVRVSARPSDLPPGHRVRVQSETVGENYFRDHPAAVREYGDLVEMAHADAVRARVMRLLAKKAVRTAIYATARTPVERTAATLIAEIVMEQTM